jgi:cytidylate kinase
MIIAIDGPAASGKGTLARRIAQHFGLAYLDTGSLYRAVARDALEAGLDLDDPAATAAIARRLDPATLGDPSLKDRGIGEAASLVARHPQVRAALLEYQRTFARVKPGAVIDGRDIGTVVCPDADAKIFVTADLGARARRRFLELEEKGEAVSEAGVRAVIAGRDKRDSERASAPLAKAADADLLDTTDLDIEQAFEAAVLLIERRLGRIGQ